MAQKYRNVEYGFGDIGSALYRGTVGKDGIRLVITRYLEDAPQEVIDDVIRFLLDRKGGYRPERFEEYIATDEFILSKRPLFLEESRKFKCTSEGEFRSLADSAQRLLDSGLLDAEDLQNTYITWSKRRAVRTLGVCYAMFRVISITPALDTLDVPEQCLDFVVYHEFLHLRVGVRIGKRNHNKSFRDQERMFPNHEEVEKELRKLKKRRSETYTQATMGAHGRRGRKGIRLSHARRGPGAHVRGGPDPGGGRRSRRALRHGHGISFRMGCRRGQR
ncbi:MAG: M48 family metallopeptidase [Candidatus Methanomethylophilaceae archaeon]|nr:M48 family metallopeptidase [Candidatus Methanomethylophilaceae archaeon]